MSRHISKSLFLLFLSSIVLSSSFLFNLILANIQQQDDASASMASFPGVTRDVLPFCSSRPSLPISLAMMVVHIKRDVSFNYKLYLLSDNYVFQTGQVIPRDDFKIHAFPAKVKRLSEFWPSYPRSFMQPVTTTVSTAAAPAPAPLTTTANVTPTTATTAAAAADAGTTVVAGGSTTSSSIDSLLIDNNIGGVSDDYQRQQQAKANQHQSERDNMMNNKQRFKILPVASFSSFDINTTYLVRKDFGQKTPHILKLNIDANLFEVTNYINLTDRDSASLMAESDLMTAGLHWDDEPSVTGTGNEAGSNPRATASNSRQAKNLHMHQHHNHEDYDFLDHPILTDVNTRIMAITQIYEEWITRNYYTIVYVERRMSTMMPDDNNDDGDGDETGHDQTSGPSSEASASSPTRPTNSNNNNGDNELRSDNQQMATIYDRLIFRGGSTSLLAADQIDYPVEAAAFITEKNKLHYWLEFLSQGENRFQLRAIEWAARPFKVHSPQFNGGPQHNWQLLDNEELVLCPPSVCYSYQPVDEIIDYGYIPLPPPLQANDDNQSVNLIPSAAHTTTNSKQQTYLHSPDLIITSNNISNNIGNKNKTTNDDNNNNNNDLHALLDPEDSIARDSQSSVASGQLDNSTAPEGALNRFRRFFNYVLPKTILDRSNGRSLQHSATPFLQDLTNLDYLKQLHFDTKLHLRDWIWPLHLSQQPQTQQLRFEFKYDEGHRNPIKARTDNYGYIVTGHNIDASFRVFNEIYLISANLLITINYTQTNESVVTKTSLHTEYPGLESTIDDPITAAYYDRYQNLVYFIKGDRYLCYDFSTKNLQARFQNSQTAPIMSLIGYQIRVDAIYHSISSDLVFVFSGMRYYTYRANEFTDGYSNIAVGQNVRKRASMALSEAKCINSKFFAGCQFDKAFKNPCQERQESAELLSSNGQYSKLMPINSNGLTKDSDDFYSLQQSKIRTMASSNGQLNNKLIYNAKDNTYPHHHHQQQQQQQHHQHQNQNLSNSPEIVPLEGLVKERHSASCASQAIITYLTILSILLASIIAIILVVIISNWRRLKLLLAGPTEPYLDRAALNKVKNFPLSEPELSNSSL